MYRETHIERTKSKSKFIQLPILTITVVKIHN